MAFRILLPRAALLSACLFGAYATADSAADCAAAAAGDARTCSERDESIADETALLAVRQIPNIKTPSKKEPVDPVSSVQDQLKACLDNIPCSKYYPNTRNESEPSTEKMQSWQLHNSRVQGEMRPLAVVFALKEEDVRAASQCASEAKLPISGQSGRHSYLAYCTSECLLINVQRMKRVDIDDASGTAILGAGLNLGQAYTHLADKNWTIPGGTCPTVGLAGLTLGGGKGPLMRMAGLLSDSVLAVQVVLHNGTLLWADNETASDLYWLSRGGGGNVFPGVVLAFKFALLKAPEVMTEWIASWPMFCEKGGIAPGVKAFQVWQDQYVAHPDRRVYVRIEMHPVENRVTMIFKFIGMDVEEAKPFTNPALRALGNTKNNNGVGEWTSLPYITSVQRAGGIGMQSFNGTCATWENNMTAEDARFQMLMAAPAMCSYQDQRIDPTCSHVDPNDWTVPAPTFCPWDSSFDISAKYRGLVMERLSDTAIEAFITQLKWQPEIHDIADAGSWQFYLQIDPTNGKSGELGVHETPYPWRSREDMTMQVIAKWPGADDNPVLQGFNHLLVSELQPYVGTNGYYNYPDDKMPGGAVELYSYYGPNAKRVIDTHRRYTDVRINNGFVREIYPGRANMSHGMQDWLPSIRRTDLSADPVLDLYGTMMIKDNGSPDSPSEP